MPTFDSPVSDESSSEGTPLRQFVDETIAQEEEGAITKLQPPTPRATSPRQALLSHSSLHDPITDVLHDDQTTTLDAGRSRRSASDRQKRNRDITKPASTTASSTKPDRELVRLLHEQEVEASKLRNSLRMAIRRMEAESRRVMDLEKLNQTASLRVRELSESKQAAEQEASKAQQELKVYQIKLDNVKQDAERTQASLKEIEKQRDEAEEAARRARAEARKVHREKAVASAREEGRRLGFEAGFEHARRERQMIAARQAQQAAAAAADAAAAAPVRGESQRTRSSSHGPSRSASSKTRTSSSHGRERRHRSVDRTPRGAPVEMPAEPPLPPVGAYPEPQHPPQHPPLDPNVGGDDESETDSLQLPLRNLPHSVIPDTSTPGRNANPLPPFTSNGTPRYSYQIPPEKNQPRVEMPVPPPVLTESPIQEPAGITMPVPDPGVVVYPVTVPPAEQLPPNVPHNDHSIPMMPREQWVPAKHFGTTPPHSPHKPLLPPGQGPPPPPLPPPTHKRPGPTPISKPSTSAPGASSKPLGKLFSFHKTKQQAASWYRTLSFRKKNKPVIDPGDEPRPALDAQPPATSSKHLSAPPGAPGPLFPVPMSMPTPGVPEAPKSPSKSAKGKERADDSSEDESDAQYGAPTQPGPSWYQPRGYPVPTVQDGGPHVLPLPMPKRRSQDPTYGQNTYPQRLISDAASASTKALSQLDLLSTPKHTGANRPGFVPPGFYPPGTVGSTGSGAGRPKAVREKDSVLSMIKEDPSSSRGNTPIKERMWGGGGAGSAVYAYGGHSRSASTPTPVGHAPVYPGGGLFAPLNGKPSHGTMNTTGTGPSGHERGRTHSRGLSIDVPDPHAQLLPPGAAYQGIPPGYHPYYNGSVGGGGAGVGLAHKPSRISEKTTPNTATGSQIGIDVIPPSGAVPDFPRTPPHTGVNHLSPYHTYQPPANRSTASLRSHHKTPSQPPQPSTPAQAYASSHSPYNTVPSRRRDTEDDKRSMRSTGIPKTPKSTRSRKSTLHLHVVDDPPPLPVSSQNRTPGPPRAGSISPAPSRGPPPEYPSSNTPQPRPQSTDKSHLMIRRGSNISLRSMGSYGKYDPNGYTDPAFWGMNGPGDENGPPARPLSRSGTPGLHNYPPAPPPMGFGGGLDGRRPISRVGSAASGLSYV